MGAVAGRVGGDRQRRPLGAANRGLERELRLRRRSWPMKRRTAPRGLDQDILDLAHLRRVRAAVDQKTGGVACRPTWGEWLARLSELASSALREPEGVIETLWPSSRRCRRSDRSSCSKSSRCWRRGFASWPMPPPRRRYGHVFVGSTDAARGHDFDVVFVPRARRKALSAKGNRRPDPARRRAPVG